MRILLVEDDEILGDAIKTWLTMAAYAVDWTRDGRSAELALQTGEYAVALLDLTLPRLHGDQLLRQQRARGMVTPVIVITARNTIPDRVAALDIGADDYLSKPFALEELLARIRAVVRRSHGRAAPAMRCQEILLDPCLQRVTISGIPVNLSSREFSVLRMLMENHGKPVTRRALEESLYAWDHEVESNTVAVHVHSLRRKLGEHTIKTKRGFGYIIE